MSTELPVTVPGPVSPDARAAWYAPDVRSQYHVSDGIVATVTEREKGYHYRTREPVLSEEETDALEAVRGRFRDATLGRPRTRAGAVERVRIGLPDRFRERLPELDGRRPASRRRLSYHVLGSLRALGALTPLALDDRIRIADTNADRLAVHTRDFAPALTDLPVDAPFLDRFLGERVRRERISFAGFSIPVTIVRGHLLGADSFEASYVIEEPDLLPGDRAVIDAVIDRILETPPAGILEDETEVVTDRARTLLRRRLGYRPVAWAREVLPRSVIPWRSRADPIPAGRSERLDALSYYVLRDLVGDGKLTVPMRDPAVRSIEANRVGDRITVVTHRGTTIGDTRMPTTRTIADDAEFVDLARSLAAEGGVELSVHRPSATVSLERETGGGQRELHCSVSLPEDATGHVSITSQRETPPTPIELVERGQFEPELVAGIWTAAAHRGSVLFVGPVDAEPTAAMGAHTPFIPAGDRPVEFGAAAGRVSLPHETAIAVPDRAEGDSSWERRTERDALHPDVAVLSDLETAESLRRLGTIIGSGRPIFAAARAATRSLLSHRVEAAGIAPTFRSRVSLVVELPTPDAGESATGWVPVAPTPDAESAIGWEPLVAATRDSRVLSTAFTDRLATGSDQPPLEGAFARRRQYVRYLRREGSTDRESLLGFLADLRTDETATIERIGARSR
ncbi:MAG: secretion system protein [Halodesulfurarchaeum sp.]